MSEEHGAALETSAPYAWRPARWDESQIAQGASDRQIRVREAAFRRSLAVADVLAAAAALIVCTSVLGEQHLQPIALLALPLILATSQAHGLYDRDAMVLNTTTVDELPKLFQCATLYALLVVLLGDALVHGDLGMDQVLGLWVTLFGVAVLARTIARLAARRLTPPERCLFIGSHESYDRLHGKFGACGRGASLVGRISLDGHPREPCSGIPRSTLRRLIDEHGVHRMIVEPSEARPQSTLDFVRDAKAIGVRVSLLPRILEVVGATVEVDDLDGLTLLGVRRFGLSRSSRVLKRSFDAAAAAVGLLVLLPLLAAVAVLIVLDTPGPVFFRQLRVGRDGRPFEIWKFRTMVAHAEELKSALGPGDAAAHGLFKLPDDPRVTRVGRRLRRSSLDELPQLVNVLRGEMSLVGPRPLIADEDRQITGHDRSRLNLTPGMTGHWQVQGGRTSLAEMIKLDYLYVSHWSLLGDMKILLRTAAHVLARRGM